MKFREMRDLTQDDVRAKLAENFEEMFRLRLRVASRQLSNTARMREVRRDVARLKTRQRQLELERAVNNE